MARYPGGPSDRSFLRVSRDFFVAETLAREGVKGQPLRGPWARGCTGIENTNRNKEKKVIYGS